MKTGDHTQKILEIKQRNLHGNEFLSYDLQALQMQWSKSKDDTNRTPDFYIIRAVTIIEVGVRRNIASLVDHSQPYTQRAVEFSKHFKIDFELVRNIQGRAITLGDIVAHTVPVNSLGQIIGYFETLLGKQLRSFLSQAVDRWAVEIEGKAREPIIHDFDKVAERLTRLFELRHILCHELPAGPAYAEQEINELLESAIQFAKALQEVLQVERFGLRPLTQTEMNVEAYEHFQKSETEMMALLSQLRSYVTHNDAGGETSGNWEGTWPTCLDEAQEKWLLYRNAQCEFETYLNRGGTIRGMIYSSIAEKMTKERIVELQSSWDWISHLWQHQ